MRREVAIITCADSGSAAQKGSNVGRCFLGTAAMLLITFASCKGTAPNRELGPDGNTSGNSDADTDPVVSTDPLDGLLVGDAQWMALCAKGHRDPVAKALCDGRTEPPSLTSLADVRELLGLGRVPGGVESRVTFLGHSTAVGGRHITPLNPRAFVFTPPIGGFGGGGPNPEFTVLAFARGENLVEIVTNDPTQNDALRFYLIRFSKPCDDDAAGCSYAETFAESVESGWSAYSVYDDESIQNTVLDCLQCHQSDGPGTQKTLLMQEHSGPWNHWFYEEHPTHKTSQLDFIAMHEGENYAGIPMSRVLNSRPFLLHRLIDNNGYAAQDNEYDSGIINAEVAATGRSATWDALYANSVSGRNIAVPYWGVTQVDATKATTAIAGYRAAVTGQVPLEEMPNIADILNDAALSDMSYQPRAGATGREILQHMCRHCHNSDLDQTQSRAGFNVDTLDTTLSRQAKDAAIQRVGLSGDNRLRMPPSRFHTLSDAEISLVVEELRN